MASTSETAQESMQAEIAQLKEQVKRLEAELAWWRRQSSNPAGQRSNFKTSKMDEEVLGITSRFVVKRWGMMVWHGSSFSEILPDEPTRREELSKRVRETIATREAEVGTWTEEENESLFQFLDVNGDGAISASDFACRIIVPLALEQKRSLVAGLGLEDVIARMLMPSQAPRSDSAHDAETEPENIAGDVTLLQVVEGLARKTQEEVRMRLQGLEELVAASVREAAKAFEDGTNLQRLASGNSKFSSVLHYKFGNLQDFKEGFHSYLGLPDKDVLKAMEFEHLSDARGAFTAKNYGTLTDPATEFTFAFAPHSRREPFPGEAAGGAAGRVRRGMEELMEEEAVRRADLSYEEVLAVRLYSGPMFQIYNDILRQRPVHRPYRTTLLMLISAVMKMAWTMEVPASRKVYRGLKGGELPASFLVKGKDGCRGGVEWGFMSTSEDKEQAAHYAGKGAFPILFELDVGQIDRGADISSLSQYPTEKEVLFPPMSNLEVFGEPRVDMTGGKPMMILQVRVSMNLRHRTREELHAERKHIFVSTLRNTVQEVACELDSLTRSRPSSNPFLQKHEVYVVEAKQQVLQECMEVMASFESLCADWFHDDHRYKNAVLEAARMRILAMTKFTQLWETESYTNPQLSWRSKPMSEVHLEAACQLRALYTAATHAPQPDPESMREGAFQLSVLEGLVDAGNLEMALDLEGNTALMLAAKDKSSLRARQLIHARCSIHSTNRAGRTPLLVAAQSGAANTIRELLEAKAEVNRRDRAGLGCVLLASSNLHSECVRVLLEAGADADAGDEAGNSPLILAAIAPHLDMMRLLISAGADLNVVNHDGGVGGTALLLAAKRGNLEAVQLLLEARAALDVQNEAGGTALMWAALAGQPLIVSALLDAGADTSRVDCNGQHALKIAEELCPPSNPGRPAVISLLHDAIAPPLSSDPVDPSACDALQHEPSAASRTSSAGRRSSDGAVRRLSTEGSGRRLSAEDGDEALSGPALASPTLLERHVSY